MKLNTISSLFLFVCLLAGVPAYAQEPIGVPDEQERQAMEEEWIRSKAENGESHASGARDDLGPVILGNPTQAAIAVRVGLYYSFNSSGNYSEFSTLHHPFVKVSNSGGDAEIIDRSTGGIVALMQPGEIYDVRFDGLTNKYVISGPDIESISVVGPVFFNPTVPENLFRVESMLRGNILGGPALKPQYRGALEVARGSSTLAGRVNLVNVLELESYVKGVVANESPAFFHVEALKSQATTARGYAASNLGRYVRLGYPFDLVDSSASQVYKGVLSEHPRTILATDATRGLVGTYNGSIITAYYSSSFGGFSDNAEWGVASNPVPYLKSIYDGDEGTEPDFTDEANIANFWTSLQLQTFDMCQRVGNRFARWKITLSAATIKARMISGGYRMTNGALIPSTSTITGVEVIQRTPRSNRVAVARVILDNGDTGIVEVRNWTRLRATFGTPSVSTPAFVCSGSNIASGTNLTNPSVIEPIVNAGVFTGVNAYGGGWGHNTGMSQYGAHGRGLAGQSFMKILKDYYTGIDVSSFPIDIGRDPGTGPPTLRQQFNAPNGIGTLVVRSDGLKKLSVHINETYDIILDEEQLAAGTVSVDISQYLVQGFNTIQYNPVGRNGTATVNVVVE